MQTVATNNELIPLPPELQFDIPFRDPIPDLKILVFSYLQEHERERLAPGNPLLYNRYITGYRLDLLAFSQWVKFVSNDIKKEERKDSLDVDLQSLRDQTSLPIQDNDDLRALRVRFDDIKFKVARLTQKNQLGCGAIQNAFFRKLDTLVTIMKEYETQVAGDTQPVKRFIEIGEVFLGIKMIETTELFFMIALMNKIPNQKIIVEYFLSIEDGENALKVFTRLGGDSPDILGELDSLLTKLVDLFLVQENPEKAQEAASKMKDSNHLGTLDKDGTFNKIFKYYLEKEMIDECEKIALVMKDQKIRNQALFEIVELLINQKNFEKASQLLQEISWTSPPKPSRESELLDEWGFRNFVPSELPDFDGEDHVDRKKQVLARIERGLRELQGIPEATQKPIDNVSILPATSQNNVETNPESPTSNKSFISSLIQRVVAYVSAFFGKIKARLFDCYETASSLVTRAKKRFKGISKPHYKD